jgi:hypothetical protein
VRNVLRYIAWTDYSGHARIWLAAGLLTAAVAVAAAGIVLPTPIRWPRPGPRARAVVIGAWVASLLALLVCASVYLSHLIDEMQAAGLTVTKPRETILPVTLAADAALLVILLAYGSSDPRRRPSDAVIAVLAAPMIFELPFDPLIIVRPTLATLPGLAAYRLLVYAPLLLTEVTTLLLLWLCPAVRLTRATFFGVASMLAVWALWALAGFGYPSTALPITWNIVSKLLAIATALTLFPLGRSVRSRSA